jgi:hypothetical protein
MMRAVATRVAALERLESVRARPRTDDIDWATPIDRSRRFFCETLTPLYYTPSYARLAPAHRRRYTQLMGMLSNELIAWLEADFVDHGLARMQRVPGIGAELVQALARFREDERRHADAWHRLNRLSEPTWYAEPGGRRLLGMPAVVGRLAPIAAHQPWAGPAMLWMQLLQEERSVDISRRCLKLPADTIEPRYAAVYREHLRDEVRHVQLDCHLIAHVHASQSRAGRLATAAVLRWAVRHFFLRPARSAMRLVRILAAEYPELRPLVPAMTRELRRLVDDEAYNEMMYSRATTPITFAMFDAYPELHAMREVLPAYRPAGPGRPQ